MLWEFLFRTLFGWWILFLVAATLIGGGRALVRAWSRRRRVMAATAARLANPGDAEVRFTLAREMAESRRWKRALELMDEAIGISSTDTRYNHVPHKFRCLRAACLYARGRWVDASAEYRRALEVPSDVGYDRALLGVAKSELRAGRFAEALEFARHAIGENGSMLEAYYRWAQAAAATGDDAEVGRAHAEFRRVVALLPPFARQRRLWWRLAFGTFPLSRRIG